MQSIMKNIAPPYDNSPCTKGEYRVVDDKIYLCKEDTSGVFDISKWEQVFLTDFIRGQLNENVESNLADKKDVTSAINSAFTSFTSEKKLTKIGNVCFLTLSGNPGWNNTTVQLITDSKYYPKSDTVFIVQGSASGSYYATLKTDGKLVVANSSYSGWFGTFNIGYEIN